MLNLFVEHFRLLVVCTTILIALLIGFKVFKFKKMAELDMRWKKYENGQIVQEGRARNIWDYSFFPGFSRLWHHSEWQMLLTTLLLVTLLLLYLWTKDEKLLNLVGLNIGVVIGMMIRVKQTT